MKPAGLIIGYECLFDCTADQSRLPPAVIGDIYRLLTAEGAGVDEDRVSYLFNLHLEERMKRIESSFVETSFSDVADRVLEELEIEDVSLTHRIVNIVSEHYMSHSSVRPQARSFLEKMKEDMKIGLVCNSPLGLPHTRLTAQIRNAEIGACFDDMQFSSEMGMCRPHARQFRFALSNLGLTGGECMAVTSVKGDIDTLRKLFFASVYYLGRGNSAEQPVFEIEHLEHIRAGD
jgi:FMN phosphatase YigB (HAD superfamily)